LGSRALARLKTVFETDDPTHEISATWGVKELLRRMFAAHGRVLQPVRVQLAPDPRLAGSGSWRPEWTSTRRSQPGSQARSKSGGRPTGLLPSPSISSERPLLSTFTVTVPVRREKAGIAKGTRKLTTR